MTNKTVTLTERQYAIIKTALGEFGMAILKLFDKGEEVELDGVQLTATEMLDVSVLIRDAQAASAEPEVLTDREKFLIGGALGALFFQMDSAAKSPRGEALVAQLKSEVLVAANKLQLKQGALNGAGDFLRSL